MRVSSLMQAPPITCAPTASVREVCELMAEHGVGSVIVVRDGVLVGIVTDRDIALRVVAAGLSGDIRIERVMTRNVVRILTSADVHEAQATMRERRTRRLPVTDSRGTVHGIVTLDDVVRHISDEANDVTELLVHQRARP